MKISYLKKLLMSRVKNDEIMAIKIDDQIGCLL